MSCGGQLKPRESRVAGDLRSGFFLPQLLNEALHLLESSFFEFVLSSCDALAPTSSPLETCLEVGYESTSVVPHVSFNTISVSTGKVVLS